MKEDWLGGTWRMRDRCEKSLVLKSEGERPLGDIEVDVKIVLIV
jgi:hypothetical protein